MGGIPCGRNPLWEESCVGGILCGRNPLGEESRGRNPMGGIPCRRDTLGEESRVGGIPCGRNPVWEESCVGGIPWEESRGRDPVWEESRWGGIPWGRNTVGGIPWEESHPGGILMEPISDDLTKDEKGGDLLNAGGRECIVQVLYLVYTVHCTPGTTPEQYIPFHQHSASLHPFHP